MLIREGKESHGEILLSLLWLCVATSGKILYPWLNILMV
jgi:hypothetical protein